MAKSEIIGAWKTKDGREIPYSQLEMSHLKNIIQYVEKKARDGVTVYCGGGYPDDPWMDEDFISGDEVTDRFNYKALKEEELRRDTKTKTEEANG